MEEGDGPEDPKTCLMLIVVPDLILSEREVILKCRVCLKDSIWAQPRRRGTGFKRKGKAEETRSARSMV